MSDVEWNPIRAQGEAAFERFQTVFQEFAASDPRWQVAIEEVSGLGNHISAQYYETEEEALSGTSEKAVDIHASMDKFPSSGQIYMRGNEAWVFERSEKVGAGVENTLRTLLQEAGLTPRPYRDRTQRGRNSHWSVRWKIYPANHPKSHSSQEAILPE